MEPGTQVQLGPEHHPRAWAQRYNAAEAARMVGTTEQHLRELAAAGYAPCRIRYDGEPFFAQQEIVSWAKANLYRAQEGRALPEVKVYALSGKVAEGPVPSSLCGVGGLREYVEGSPPCVYFLCLRGEVVYVGQTVDLPGRLGAHRAGQNAKMFDRVFFLPIPLSELLRVEAAFIRALAPPLNTARKQRPATEEDHGLIATFVLPE